MVDRLHLCGFRKVWSYCMTKLPPMIYIWKIYRVTVNCYFIGEVRVISADDKIWYFYGLFMRVLIMHIILHSCRI